MGAPTLYSSNDAGVTWPGPEAVSIRNAYKSSYYAIYHMLKSCLVEGYTGKPAAGWTMLFDEIATGTGVAYALTNASKSGVILVDVADANNSYMRARISVCDSLPALDSPVNLWSNRYGPAAGQAGLGHFWCPDANSSFYATTGITASFYLVANDNACYFSLHSKSTELFKVDISNGNDEDVIAVYLGASNGPANLGTISAPELGNFIVAGGEGVTYSNSPSNQSHKFQYNTSGLSGIASRLRSHTGGTITDEPPLFGNMITQGASRSQGDPDTLTHSLITRLILGEGANYGYRMRFTYKTPLYIDLMNWDSLATRPLLIAHGGDFYTPTTINGREYIAFTAVIYTHCPLVSLDPADWV